MQVNLTLAFTAVELGNVKVSPATSLARETTQVTGAFAFAA